MNFSTFLSLKNQIKSTPLFRWNYFIFLLFFTIVFTFFGCKPKESKKSSQLKVAQEVKICSLSTCATAILLNLNHPVAAIDSFGQIVNKDPNLNIPIIGKSNLISLEKLVSLQITHVILWDYQKSLVPKLKELNIQAVTLPAFRLNDYPKVVKLLGKIVNKEAEANKLIDDFNQKIKNFTTNLNLSDKTAIKNVYFELYGENVIAGNDSYIGDLLKIVNARSITKKTSMISKEYILTQNIDTIFYIEGITTAKKIAQRSGFANLPAVKNKRIFPIKRELIIEGAYPVEALNYLTSKLRK
jgi:iron complex transport system substrate-binding protein